MISRHAIAFKRNFNLGAHTIYVHTSSSQDGLTILARILYDVWSVLKKKLCVSPDDQRTQIYQTEWWTQKRLHALNKLFLFPELKHI